MNIFFISLYDDIEIFIMLFTGSKNIDFSRRYVPKKLEFWFWFLGILIYKIKNLSPPRVFKIFTRGFRRYKGADIAKKTLGADFCFCDFL